MMRRLRQFIWGTPEHPVHQDDVKPAPLPPHLQERVEEQEKLSLRLMSEALLTASTASQIRKALGQEVAIKLQRRA